ncbi:MAG: DUF2207 domain-containing protein [Bacteroidota bacterium]
MSIKNFLLLPLLFLLVFSSEAKKSYYLSNYDVYLDLKENGEYYVREEITFEFSGVEYTYAYRSIPSRHLDTVYDLKVTSSDINVLSTEMERKKGYRLNWTFEPTEHLAVRHL